MKRGDVFAPLRMKGTDLYPPCRCERERRVSSEVRGYLQAFLFHISGNPTNQDLPALFKSGVSGSWHSKPSRRWGDPSKHAIKE